MLQNCNVQSKSPIITFTAYKTSSNQGVKLNEVISTFQNDINNDSTKYIDPNNPDERNITINGISAYQISVRGSSNAGNNRDYYNRAVIFENKGRIYILYFSMQDYLITAEYRSLFESYCDKILQNLKIE